MNEKAPRTRGLFGLGSGAAKRPFFAMNLTIHLKTSPPPDFQGAQGVGCLSKKNFFADLF